MGFIGPRHHMPGVVYQEQAALARYVEAGVLTDETLASAFRATAARFPHRLSLCEGAQAWTHAELDVVSDKAAAAFLGLGLKPLDRVIFQLPNSAELVIAFIACLKAGLIPVCTLAAHRSLEIGYIGHHARARAHIVAGGDPKFDFAAFSLALRPAMPSLGLTIVTGRAGGAAGDGVYNFDTLIAAQDITAARARLADVDLDPFQVALFQLSGGTTGVPKIIPRFHNEYLYTLRTVMDFHALDETTVAYTPNPMMHNAPMCCVWAPALLAGGAVAACQSFDPAVLGPFLAARQPNWLLVPPPVLFKLREAGWLERLDLSRAKGLSSISGNASLSAMLGAPVWPLFGMTEGLLCYCNSGDPLEARNATNGRTLSAFDELQIFVPGTQTPAEFGETGELAVRGPCTIRGYYDAADRNAEAFTADGFYRSGDLMRLRRIGAHVYVVFEGRVKDVVDRGGEKINCEEVERLVVTHPAIAAAAVVAMPDPLYGERACAFVLLAPGAIAPSVKDLGAHLLGQGMAKFKWPERIEPVAEFPLTSAGKLSKARLREIIAARLKEEAGSAP